MPAILVFLLSLLLLFVLPAVAADHPCAVGDEVEGLVSRAFKLGGFALEGSEQTYFPAGLIFPAGIENAPAYAGARTGADAEVYRATTAPDRYGRMAAHTFVDGEWLEEKLLRSGLALVFGDGLPAACAAAMRQAEREGEEASAGLWQEARFAFGADDLELLSEMAGKFVLVKGKITSVGDRSRAIYLNFGQNWSHDFTVSVAKTGNGAFKGDAAQLAGLKNRTVRVRGILDLRQGPLIRLNDETQIEVLD